MYVIRHDSSIEDDLRVSGYSYLCQKNSSIKHEWHSSTQPCLEPVMAKTLRQSQHDWRSAVSIIYVIDASTPHKTLLFSKNFQEKNRNGTFSKPLPPTAVGGWLLISHFRLRQVRANTMATRSIRQQRIHSCPPPQDPP